MSEDGGSGGRNVRANAQRELVPFRHGCFAQAARLHWLTVVNDVTIRH
jgi:hypothetical protein